MEKTPILVIGKHGKTGSRVNKRLQTLATRGNFFLLIHQCFYLHSMLFK